MNKTQEYWHILWQLVKKDKARFRMGALIPIMDKRWVWAFNKRYWYPRNNEEKPPKLPWSMNSCFRRIEVERYGWGTDWLVREYCQNGSWYNYLLHFRNTQYLTDLIIHLSNGHQRIEPTAETHDKIRSVYPVALRYSFPDPAKGREPKPIRIMGVGVEFNFSGFYGHTECYTKHDPTFARS